jgi:NTE family protein
VTESEDMNQLEGAPEAPPKVLLTFQGGGAKGIVHVGALKAVEEMELEVRGVAGTSAGAMVAALVAAGYSSREMIDAETQKNIVTELGAEFGCRKVTDFFGSRGWIFVSWLKNTSTLAYWGPTLVLVGLVLLAVFADYHPYGALFVIATCVGLAVIAALYLFNGITTVDRVRSFVDYAIARKVSDGEGTKDITFRDLHAAGKLPLKIVATNISDERAEVFSYERTPDVAIADAVAASICLPIVFKPWRFECKRGTGIGAESKVRRFMDGGMISNLPVWTLDHELKSAPECIPIAFSIREEPDPNGRPREENHWLAAIASAVVAGSLELDTRGIENMVLVPIACTLGVLDFDQDADTFHEAVDRSRTLVRERLRQELTEFPEIFTYACDELIVGVKRVLNGLAGVLYPSAQVPDVKVAVVVQLRDSYTQLSIKVQEGFGHEDPELELDHLQVAWNENTVILKQYEENKSWQRPFWRILVPISHREENEQLPRIEGQFERPLILVIETDAQLDMSNEQLVNDFVSEFNETVVGFADDYRLYDAVQRSTSSPWH